MIIELETIIYFTNICWNICIWRIYPELDLFFEISFLIRDNYILKTSQWLVVCQKIDIWGDNPTIYNICITSVNLTKLNHPPVFIKIPSLEKFMFSHPITRTSQFSTTNFTEHTENYFKQFLLVVSGF
nr:CLL_HP1_G0004480.mRNA.1.CDS.1 [Saccharomyces cerevisiae]